MQLKDFYTVPEAAKELNILPATLRTYINAGKLAATKLNGAYLIEKAEFERYKEERAKHDRSRA